MNQKSVFELFEQVFVHKETFAEVIKTFKLHDQQLDLNLGQQKD